MNHFSQIQIKLKQFIIRYYQDKLIKGFIFFVSLGLLYFLFTLFIEYFLWLPSLARKILFWIFIIIEVGLFVYYIGIPLLKLLGLRERLTVEDAAKIIGTHFKEIDDKLLNTLQLIKNEKQSDLLLASINQRSKLFLNIPFKKAVNFKFNLKYLKYAVLPLFILLLILFSGKAIRFKKSFSRVVHYNLAYVKPAPFKFKIKDSLEVIEGKNYKLQIETIGDELPEDAKIIYNQKQFDLQKIRTGLFEFNFNQVQKDIAFFIIANNYKSDNYNLNVLIKPSIIDLKMLLVYPKYIHKKNNVITNTGNAIVPQGTIINWQVYTQNTDSIHFHSNKNKVASFTKNTVNLFSYKKRMLSPVSYEISSSNRRLKNYEKLAYQIRIINDEYPKIEVKKVNDSLNVESLNFEGTVSDDYGVKKLELVYFKNKNPKNKFKKAINLSNANYVNFSSIFPNNEVLEKGENYTVYFLVYDNDGVNGSKKTKSRMFSFYQQTEDEKLAETNAQQIQLLNSFQKTLQQDDFQQKETKFLFQQMNAKENLNFNDTKALKDYLKRQNNYQKNFNKQTNLLKDQLQKLPSNKTVENQKNELLKRIEETKKLADKNKLINEIQKLAEKLNRENLLKKLDELSKKNKRNKLNLKRLLELTKRFYIEQKANKISEELGKLAITQKELANKKWNDSSYINQKKVNQKFSNINQSISNLLKLNKELNKPKPFLNVKEQAEEINSNLQNNLKSIKNKNENKSQSQKKTASNMKRLSEQLKQQLKTMSGQEIDENIDDLRAIIENLITFSFKQEKLYKSAKITTTQNPEYTVNLNKQQNLKEFFAHIDDSLYVLSLRLVQLSSNLQKDIDNTHYFINKSLNDFSDNNYLVASSDQRYVITSVNNLANNLSKVLKSLMNASPSFGKGKSGKNDFSLPDIIKNQGKLGKEMMKKLGDNKKGGKPSDSKNLNSSEEQRNADLFEFYKRQAQLKEALVKLLNKGANNGNGNKANKLMNEIEKQLLNKNLNENFVKKINQLNYELLEFDKANKLQGIDKKRQSKTGNQNLTNKPNDFKITKEAVNKDVDLLIRHSLPLQKFYKKKVNQYFKNLNK